MTNVHLLCNIWRGEINNNTFPPTNVWGPHAILQDLRHLVGNELLVQMNVDETWASDLHFTEEGVIWQAVDDILSNFPRVGFLATCFQDLEHQDKKKYQT